MVLDHACCSGTAFAGHVFDRSMALQQELHALAEDCRP